MPICGKDFKTGQTLMKTVLAPGIQGAHAGPRTAGFRRTFSAIATAKCWTIRNRSKPRKNRSSARSNTSCSRSFIPSFTARCTTRSASTITRRAATTKKAGTTSISSAGCGYPMQIKVDFLCRDSILAAPIVLDLVLFLDLAQARRDARHSGVAQLLLQIAHVRAGALSGARPLHSVHEAEEHAALDDGRGTDHAPRRRNTTIKARRAASESAPNLDSTNILWFSCRQITAVGRSELKHR